MAVDAVRTIEYAPGRFADVFGEWTQPAVLLWHGTQTDARAAVGPLSGVRVGSPFTLLHGLADDVVPVAASRNFAASLRQAGWQVELVNLAADHGSIAGAEYDPVADRYGPGTGERTLSAAGEVAARIAVTLR